MLYTIRIIAQYSENYADNKNTPYWKIKGEIEFLLQADSDLVMYNQNEADEVIKEMLAAKSNAYVKYEYVSKKMLFYESEQLDGIDFENRMMDKITPKIAVGDKIAYQSEWMEEAVEGECTAIYPNEHPLDNRSHILFLEKGGNHAIQVFLDECRKINN